jgi:hypothetical protein
VDFECHHSKKNLRVVACLLEFCHDRAMTRIGYVKPQMFETSSRPSQRPPNNGCPLLYPSSFRLQSTTRHVLPLSSGWDPEAFLGLVPFSAITTGRDTRDFRSRSSPLSGFCNLSAGSSPRMAYEFIPPR